MTQGTSYIDYSSLFQCLILSTAGFYYMWKSRGKSYAHKVYFMLGGIFGIALGDVFFVTHLLLYGDINYFAPSDIAWIGGFYFIIAAHHLLQLDDEKAPWYAWGFTVVMKACFLHLIFVYGGIIVNILWAIPLIALSWCAGVGLKRTRKGAGKEHFRPFYLSLTVFLLNEMLLFMSWGTVYLIADILLTAIVVSILITYCVGLRKESAIEFSSQEVDAS